VSLKPNGFSLTTPVQSPEQSLTGKSWDLLVDALTNSMDLYGETDFVKWFVGKTELNRNSLAKIHQSYWLLDPLERDGFNDDEWREWVHQTLNLR
jgi:hypothetical protein